MRSRFIVVSTLALALVLVACSTGSEATPETIVVTATPADQPAEPPPDAPTTLPPEMLDVEWQLHSVLENEPAAQSVVPQPQNYTIQFAADGTAAILADCNNVGASYTVSGTNLTLTLGPATLAFCGEDSGDNLYMTALGGVTSYVMSEYGMVLDVSDVGQLQYIENNDIIDIPDEPGGVDIVADVNLQVRTGPGTQFRISHWATAGDQGDVIGQSADDLYWVVPFPDDHPHYDQGWVLKSTATISNPDNLEIPVITPPLLNPTVYVTPPEAGQAQGNVFQTAEIMTGPGSSYDKIMDVEMGTTMGIIGVSADNTFWVVNLPTQTAAIGYGWINMDSNTCSKCDIPSNYTPVYSTP